MTIADINASLQAQLPNITLSPALFENDAALTPLLQMYFFEDNGAIHIKADAGSYNFDQTNGTIRFSGIGQSGPFRGLTMPKVLIKMVDGAPQLAIRSTPPDDSTITALFPSLNAPVLQELPCKEISFYWDSYDSETDNTLQGFYFEGNLDFSIAPLNVLSFIFPATDPPSTLWGQIKMRGTSSAKATQYVPDMMLIMDSTADQATLGPFTLEGPRLQINSNPYFNTSDLRWQTDSKIHVSMLVAFKDTWFELVLSLNDASGNIIFNARLDTPLGGALADIVQLTGGTPLHIPGFTISKPNDLLLKDILINYDTIGKKINLLSVEVGMSDGEKWQLWDQVYLEQIDVKFLLTPKSTGNGYDIGGMISGVISGWLSLSAGFSTNGNYSFYGRLANPDKPLTMQELYTFFTGDTQAQDFPDIEIDAFYFELNRTPDGKGGSNYSFQGNIVLEGDWDLLNTPTKISLNGLNFYLDRQEDASINFKAGGILDIADYSLSLEAAYSTDQKWVFTGELDLSDEKPGIGDMNTRVDTAYPNKPSKPVGIPPFLRSWYVQSLYVQYATLKKNLDLTMSIKNGAYAWLEMDFGIHLIHSDAAFDKVLDGAIKIDTTIKSKNIQAEFDLVFEESATTTQPPVKTYTMRGNYVTAPQTAPSLSDLLLYLAKNNPIDSKLPAELNFDAAIEGLSIEVQKSGEAQTKLQLAGTFSFEIANTTWDLYLAYTNDVRFDTGQPTSTADPAATPYVFGVAIDGLIDLSHLPLVGKAPGVDKLRLDKLGFFYTNATFSQQDQKLFFNIPAIGDPGRLAPDPTSAFLTHSGFSVIAVFGNEQDGAVNNTGTMPLPIDTGMSVPGHTAFAPNMAAPKDPVSWLELNKTLGPVSLQKIGMAYTKASKPDIQLGTIAFYVDGGFKIGGLEMALDRLGLSFNIPKPGKKGASFNPIHDIAFRLGGLFVNYQAPDMQIAGGFVSLPDDKGVNFIGEFIVQAGPFGLQAYGGFSNDMGHPSLFVFLHLNVPIGGPPFFFINGLAGGFGVNRAFVLPTFNQLANYPFLPASNTIPTAANLGTDAATKLDTMSMALTNLARYLPVQEGEYWFALGLDASSFEMIEISAVLSVAFGVKFQVGLVGSAAMTIPVKEPEPIAYIQIDFEVNFSPSDGLLASLGTITPASYLYAGFVHLSGGFAFYTWFSGTHKGDFVVTIGGYNPHYQRPAYYPDVPRLRMGFAMDSLNIAGLSYFALTGNAIMAGIAFHATWTRGPLNAWFDVGMDFLIGWKPYHYEADAYIGIDISLVINVLFVHTRINISAAVMLDIWGPSFGGKARVELHIISFTIHFGAEEQLPPAVDWTQFREFLPNINNKATLPKEAAAGNPPLVNLTVTKGLMKTYSPSEDPDGLDWLIDANNFEIHSQTIAATTDAIFNNGASLKSYTAYVDPANLDASIKNAINNHQDAPFFAYKPEQDNPAWNTLSFGIPPMALTNIQAIHNVTIQALDDNGQPGRYVTELVLVLQTNSVQTALWGNAGAKTISLKGSDAVIKGALNGFTMMPMRWFPARTAFIAYYYLVFDTNNLFLEQDILPTFNTSPVNNPDAVYTSMDNGNAFSNTVTQRASVLDLLQQQGFGYLDLKNDGLLNTDQYTAEPILAHFS
ncbi:DUF6603 domain-containing protein [Chitinophaga ginsengisoli]|uniref:DUF6603 domain-containing protein n=1 Tax=Chitinophaga ginsengisoli TaxID=363837 RepID=A0A2P8G4W3_9BACT|nr:DUF6603 domain-containing protein [Chitinophaga ginsengisoli]PSL29021.1 hypothetical protein CLV42_107167 [Chitinophaga ginsengisoli]